MNLYKLLYKPVIVIYQPEMLFNVLHTSRFWPIHNGMHFSRIYYNNTTTNNVAQIINLSLAKYTLNTT